MRAGGRRGRPNRRSSRCRRGPVRSSSRCAARRWPKTISPICVPAASATRRSVPRDCVPHPQRQHGYSASMIRRRWSSRTWNTGLRPHQAGPAAHRQQGQGDQVRVARAAAATIFTCPTARRHACCGMGEPVQAIIITEGEKKALKADQEGFRDDFGSGRLGLADVPAGA